MQNFEKIIKLLIQNDVEFVLIGGFAASRFLEAASFSQASVLNTSAVARECSVERKVVENYFSILEDLMLAYRIPAFTKRAKRRIVLHPKFFIFDTGIYRTVRPSGPLDLPEQIDGAAFETLFLQELLTANDNLKDKYDISYWRPSNTAEVDFVLYGKRGILAFEMKRSGKVRGDDLKGLKSFLKDFPMAKTYFVYGGEREERDGNITSLPFRDCIKKLPEIFHS